MKKAKALYIHGSKEAEQERLSLLNQFLNKACLKELSLPRKAHILDVGSGLGQFSRLMARQLSKKGKVVGIERDKKQWAKAKQLAEVENEQNLVDFRLGDAYQLPLKKTEWNHFDIVFSRFVLEHLAMPTKAVGQMTKAVKKGGRVILTDDDHATYRLNPEPLGFSIIWTAYCRSYERLGNDPYIGRKLSTLLWENGLQPIRLSSVFFGACAGDPNFSVISDNLLGILKGAKSLMLKEALIDANTFDNCMIELKKWQQLPDAALSYSIDWAEGVK